ncbi:MULTISPECIES: IMPACT family protein [Microbacterium]|uniref:IMPACT family protein n=1 Tax=Microbacterium TaxID=33882 RepID=UPI00217D1743|nr:MULTISPECIES: YigZ family protein [Microbacterium]UWF77085.1 YigZ family protein [Microbacterium neungamense]WCM55245.1 YigZ family protein [Microbacterium sp. EF45047]
MHADSADLPATIAEPVDHELVIRKSRFLAHVAPVASVEEADAVIAGARRRAWDARHHCSAQVLGLYGDRARSSDDGEPSGTAGMPMLEVLRRRRLTDVVAVVTRYFGGVKLGAGGLVRAYSSAVSEALDGARLVDRRTLQQVRIAVRHADAGRYDHLLRDWAARREVVLGETRYGAQAVLEVWSPGDAAAALSAEVSAASGGAVAAELTGIERIVDVPRP